MRQTPLTSPAPGSVRYYIAAFLKKHRIQKHTPDTLAYYQGNLGRFAWFLEQKGYPTTLQDLTSDNIRDFMLYLQEEEGGRWGIDSTATRRPLKPASIHAFARSLRAFFNFASKEARLSINPFSNIDMPTIPNQWKVQAFTEAEVIQLFEAANQFATPFLVKRNRAILAVLLDTGLRSSELLSLTTDAVKQSIFTIKGKGNKERYIVMGDTAQEELKPYLQMRMRLPTASNALWVSEFGRPLIYSGLQQMFSQLKEYSGITRVDVRAHVCRHTFATLAHRRGMRPSMLKELLGHEDISITLRYYVDVTAEDLAQEHTMFGPLAGVAKQVKRTARADKPCPIHSLPAANTLLEEVKASNYRAVARKYGVSDTTIRNHLKRAGLLI